MSKESLVIPSYNKEEIKIGILHLGVGNFHRAHQALYINDYLNLKNDPNWGICGVNLRKEERANFNSLKKRGGKYVLKNDFYFRGDRIFRYIFDTKIN